MVSSCFRDQEKKLHYMCVLCCENVFKERVKNSCFLLFLNQSKYNRTASSTEIALLSFKYLQIKKYTSVAFEEHLVGKGTHFPTIWGSNDGSRLKIVDSPAGWREKYNSIYFLPSLLPKSVHCCQVDSMWNDLSMSNVWEERCLE